MKILCFFGWHKPIIVLEPPKAEANGLIVHMKAACERCQKEFAKGGLNMNFTAPTSPDIHSQFNFTEN
jgi:hypothetical protein